MLKASFAAVIALQFLAIPAVPQSASKIPRTTDGKPDLSGLWDHPFVIDMSKDGRNDACGAEVKGCSQKADGPLPMTEWAADWFKNYDPGRYDATAHCNPMGYTRSMNAPVATEIVQTPKEIVFLHESMFAFHVVYLDGRPHPTADEAKETFWYGHSVGHWDGDTLVVDTVGPFFATPKMLLDTAGHPVSEDLHVVERYSLLDRDHIDYRVTIEDPKVFTRPWNIDMVLYRHVEKNFQLLEYECYGFDLEQYYP